METSFQYTYLLGNISLLILWIIFYLLRKDLRRQMLTMSVFLGIVSVLTLHFWWNIDWWHPQTFTNTKVGIEDFLIGFSSGGIMSILYEVILKKRYYRITQRPNYPRGRTIALILFVLTGVLIWGFKLASFLSSFTSLFCAFLIMIYFRKDLFLNALVSGMGMTVASLLFYVPIIFFYPDWMNATYDASLSGTRLIGIPIEELLFWFFSGLVWGPFYKYSKHEFEKNHV